MDKDFLIHSKFLARLHKGLTTQKAYFQASKQVLNFRKKRVEITLVFKERIVDWKDYFKITVLRETLQGPHRYFQADLRVREEFNMEELLMREFEYLSLTEDERKLFSLNIRKIFVRHKFFKTPEFDRIVENFAQRISSEKKQLLTFSTHGGGVYLFMGLMKKSPNFLHEKKLICYTSELPLDFMKVRYNSHPDIHIILRPQTNSLFKNFPTLWQKSNLIDLYEVHEA